MKTLTVALALTLALMFGGFNPVAVAQNTKPVPVVTTCEQIQDKDKQQACFKQLHQQQMTKFAPLQRTEAQQRTTKTQLAKKAKQDVLTERLRVVGGCTCGDGMDLGMGPIGWFYVWCCNSSGCDGGWL
jgi:hypothetical protein